jgi:peptide/nickel transport system substrate-binding protein
MRCRAPRFHSRRADLSSRHAIRLEVSMLVPARVAAIAVMIGIGAPALAASDTVVIALRLEPPGLDPTTGAAAAISEVTQLNIYESLTRVDADGRIMPSLAESWTAGEDGRAYTFKLRQGVKFHDGTPFGASQVKFSYERNAAPTSTNKMKLVYANIEAVETPDPFTVKITLKKPSSLFPQAISEAPGAIMTPATAETNATKPVGTGPYRFERWVKGDSVTLVKNPDYRDAAAVKLQRVTFRFMGDENAQMAAMLAGDLDYLPFISALETVDQFKGNPQFQILVGTTEGETLLDINNGRKPFDDVRVRRALNYAVDRQAVIDGAMAGFGTPIGSHFAPHHPYYVDLTAMYPHDPKKAKALLAEAGFPNGFETTLRLPPVTYARRGGEIVAANLAEIGIRAKLIPLEWAQWLDGVFQRKEYDLTIVSHVEPMDVIRYANPNYFIQYDSAEFRALIDKAEATLDPAEQKKIWGEVQKKLAEDAAVAPLFQLAKVGVAKKGLKGLWKNAPQPLYVVSEMSWE